MASRSPSPHSPGPVGIFIREKREALSLSQRDLGQRFDPAVTTQFISNIERGVTPLPPSHVATVARALGIERIELFTVMVREYAARIRREAGEAIPDDQDSLYLIAVCQAFRNADPSLREEFQKICEVMLKVDPLPPKAVSKPDPRG